MFRRNCQPIRVLERGSRHGTWIWLIRNNQSIRNDQRINHSCSIFSSGRGVAHNLPSIYYVGGRESGGDERGRRVVQSGLPWPRTAPLSSERHPQWLGRPPRVHLQLLASGACTHLALGGYGRSPIHAYPAISPTSIDLVRCSASSSDP